MRGIRLIVWDLFRIGLICSILYSAVGVSFILFMLSTATNADFANAMIQLRQSLFFKDVIVRTVLSLTPVFGPLSLISIIGAYFYSAAKMFGLSGLIGKIKGRFS